MTTRRMDRAAFALLIPSLAVPIIAIALAAWRMGHVDDGHPAAHFGSGLNYFAAMMTLSATLFSMTVNVVLVLRNHASLPQRAVTAARVGPHYVVALVVAAWTVEFCVVHTANEGLAFGAVLVTVSLISFARVSTRRVSQVPLEIRPLSLGARGLLIAHPLAVTVASGFAAYAFADQNEGQLIAVALLGFLGLPWSGVAVLLWLPLAAISFLAHAENLPLIFLLLAGIPAIANAVLSIAFLRSNRGRITFINRFLEARTTAEADTTTLAP